MEYKHSVKTFETKCFKKLSYRREAATENFAVTQGHLKLHCVPNTETRVILNILYSFKSIAMKFSTQYPDYILKADIY